MLLMKVLNVMMMIVFALIGVVVVARNILF